MLICRLIDDPFGTGLQLQRVGDFIQLPLHLCESLELNLQFVRDLVDPTCKIVGSTRRPGRAGRTALTRNTTLATETAFASLTFRAARPSLTCQSALTCCCASLVRMSFLHNTNGETDGVDGVPRPADRRHVTV